MRDTNVPPLGSGWHSLSAIQAASEGRAHHEEPTGIRCWAGAQPDLHAAVAHQDHQTGTGTWTLTITGVPVAAFQYKFTLGSWSTVEETSSCGDFANRTFGFNTADASYTATDTVAAWEGSGGC